MVFVYSVHPSTEFFYILIMESNTAYKMESLGTGHSLKRSGFLFFKTRFLKNHFSTVRSNLEQDTV